MDPSLSFHKHCNYMADRIEKRKKHGKGAGGLVLATGQGDVSVDIQRLRKSIASYAASIWSTNASGSGFKKIQTAHNSALRTDSIDHLQQESLTLKVRDHSDMLSAQYLVNCLEEDHVCHGITTHDPRPRPMQETPL